MDQNQDKPAKKTEAADAAIKKKQKQGVGGQYPSHTQETGEYPRQQKRDA